MKQKHFRLQLLAVIIGSFYSVKTIGQNVGIGTNSPAKKLSVNGSIAVDHNATNTGMLDSAALVFGNDGKVGINSAKSGFNNPHGIDFWTNGFRRFLINQQGNAAFGVSPDDLHRLKVNGRLHASGNITTNDSLYVAGHVGIGTTPDYYKALRVNGHSAFYGSGYFDGGLTVVGDISSGGTLINHGGYIMGEMRAYDLRATHSLRVGTYAAIGGVVDSNYRLRVWGGNSRFGGDAQVTGRMAIGGDMDDSYRLRVWDGNSRFGGNMEVSGQINATSMNIDALAIGGKGAVRSDGLSPLRIGFNYKYVDVVIAGGATQEYTVNITDFAGDNDDIRVMVSQFEPAAGADPLAFERTVMSVTNVNATNETCKLKLHNSAGGALHLKGTVYLTCIAKN